MSRTVHPIREAMAELARGEVRGAEHPAPRRLVAYHRGDLPPAESAALTEHLSLCPECTALLLEAVRFLEDEEDEEAEAKETEEAWAALRAARGSREAPAPRLSPVQSTPRAMPAPSPPMRRPFLRRLPTAYGLAATLAALCLGLALYSFRAGPSAPQVNEGFYDLAPGDSERGRPGEETSIRFVGPGSSAHLVLNPRGDLTFESYRVSVLGADGKVIWSHDQLVPQDHGAFHLSLKAGSFPPGSYKIELEGWNHDRVARLGLYRIRIEG